MDFPSTSVRQSFRAAWMAPLVIGILAAGTASGSTIGYWRFESGGFTTDSSGNGYTLSQTGTVSQVATENASAGTEFFPNPVPQNNLANGNAASMVDASNVRQGFFTHTPAGSSAAFAPNNFTIEAIVSLRTDADSDSINGNAIASLWQGTGNNRTWGLGVASSTGSFSNTPGFLNQELSFVFATNGADFNSRQVLGSGFALTTGSDYYVAAAYTRPSAQGVSDGSVTFWFQDLTAAGPLQTSTQTTSNVMWTPNSTPAAFQIGSLNLSDTLRFGGVIDEVRLSDTVLSTPQLLIVPEPTGVGLLAAAFSSAWLCGRRLRWRRS